MSITEKSIEVGSLKWFYRETEVDSDQSPLLMLHGIPSQSFSWCEIMSTLAENNIRAIAPDWIGFGFSDKPDRRDFSYTPKAFIEALTNLISTLEIGKFTLVVQGFVGLVGLQYAFRNPEHIERLIVLNTPISATDKLPWQMKQWGLPLIGDVLTQDPLLVDRSLEGGSGFIISDRNLAVYRKPFLNSSDAGRALLATIKNLKLSQSIAEVETGWSNWQQPTQFIWGMADPWLSSSEVEKITAAYKNVEMVKLEEAKHYPQEHWSKEISKEILDFLR